ncbi:hypothetical protein [Phenylobacterium sp.]|uniref:hypothetical protein n=1 Tax=Phenylobacterium sp. TaxID=1871053 RepID=UPI00286E8731|nr:hypothetical protein [Phenylobacterium sp.]
MAEHRPLSPFGAWRRQHQGAIVVAVGVLFVVGVLALFAFQLRAGPGVVVYGTVTGIGMRESETGSRPVAHLEVDGRQVTVGLSRANGCQVGDRIRVYRHKQPLGVSYRATIQPCEMADGQHAQTR